MRVSKRWQKGRVALGHTGQEEWDGSGLFVPVLWSPEVRSRNRVRTEKFHEREIGVWTKHPVLLIRRTETRRVVSKWHIRVLVLRSRGKSRRRLPSIVYPPFDVHRSRIRSHNSPKQERDDQRRKDRPRFQCRMGPTVEDNRSVFMWSQTDDSGCVPVELVIPVSLSWFLFYRQ